MPILAPEVLLKKGSGTGVRRVVNFPRDPVQNFLILGSIFGVGAELVVSRTASEIGAFRVDSRQRAVGNAVSVNVEVSGKPLDLIELLRR